MYGQFSALSEVWHAAAKAHGYKILSLVLRVSVMPKCRVYVRALWKFHPMRVGEVVCEKAAGIVESKVYNYPGPYRAPLIDSISRRVERAHFWGTIAL